MIDFEKCKTLKNSFRESQGKILKMKEEIAEKIKAQRVLDEDALKGEILEEEDWEKKKEAANRNREDILRLKEKIEENQKAI